jgi:enoyl-CoA hydratase
VVAATKRQVHEALENMASTTGAWADATQLAAALADPEARAIAREYLGSHGQRT